MRKILVPLDGSVEAERALGLAAAVAARTGAGLTLVTVHEPPGGYLGIDDLAVAFASSDRQARDDERAYLDSKVQGLLSALPTAPRAVLLEGRPADELIRYAKEETFDLIVMTTHGRGGLSRLWLGSVAEQVAKRSGPPVLLIRPDTAPHRTDLLFDRVMVPLDGSQRAEMGLEWATDFLAASGVLHLLTVVPSPILFAPPARPGARPDLLLSQRRKLITYRYLRRLAKRLRGSGLAIAVHVQESLAASREIIAYAETERIELVIIATHARGGLARWALGSVADKIVRATSCQVLVCRSTAAGERPSDDYRAATEEPDEMEHVSGGAAP